MHLHLKGSRLLLMSHASEILSMLEVHRGLWGWQEDLERDTYAKSMRQIEGRICQVLM